MKLLILGGAGFLGTHLIRAWDTAPKTQITVVDTFENRSENLSYSFENFKIPVQIVRGSILDQKLMEKLIPQHDVIYNLAAQTSHTVSLKNPFLDTEVNCLGVLQILECVRLLHPKALVLYTSSTTAVGKAQDEIIDEHHPERPLDIYSANKGIAEKYHQIYHHVHGLKTISLRFGNIYGAHGKSSPRFGFINYFIHQAMKDDAISIYGKGSQIRNVLYAEDAAELLKNVAIKPEKLIGQLLQATSPYHHSVREIAETIIRVFQSGYISYKPWPRERKKIEIESVRFSSEKLRALTGWSSPTNLETGLQKTREIIFESESQSAL